MLASLNSVDKEKNRLIEITSDGVITEDEYEDFAMIQDKLEKISVTADALQLWVREKIADGNIDQSKLDRFKNKDSSRFNAISALATSLYLKKLKTLHSQPL